MRTRTARWLPAALITTLAAAGLPALAAAPAHAAAGCDVRYRTLGSWPSGFQGELVVTNTGDAVTSWTVGFELAAGQRVSSGWGGAWTPGSSGSVRNEAWNGALAAGAKLTLGFIGGWSGSGAVPAPTGFTMNGVSCTVDGAAVTPTTTTTVGVTPTTTTTRPAVSTTTTTGPVTTTTTQWPVNASIPYFSLPLTKVTAMVTDPVTGNVYVSSRTDDAVVVANRDAVPFRTIGGLDGASGMVVVGGTLYVALFDAAAIAAIDTTTLTETARYPMGEPNCPTYLTATRDTVWIGHGCPGNNRVGIGRLRLDDAPAVELGLQGSERFSGAPLLASAGPDGPLAAGAAGISPAEVSLWDLTGTGLALLRRTPFNTIGSSADQLTFSADGSQILIAIGWPYEIEVLSTATMTLTGRYLVGDSYDCAVAVSPDGTYVAAGATGSVPEPDIFVYRSNTSTRLAYDYGEAYLMEDGTYYPSRLQDTMLAWSGDSQLFYSVAQHWLTPGPPALRVHRKLP